VAEDRRIIEREAALVQRFFELAAIGYGQVQIAKMLNEEGAPAPRSHQGRPCAWVLDQWRGLDDVADARRVLRELLDGPLRFTPVIDEGVRFDGF